MPNIKWLLYFYLLVDFKLFAPIIVLYFAQVTGSFALAMSIFSATFLAQAVFEVPTGIFSDMVGRKKTYILGMTASFLSIILYALGGSFWMLLAGGVIEGLSRSFFSGTDHAFLHDTLKEKGIEGEFGKYQGRISSMDQIGLGISAVLGGVIAFFWSYNLTVWLSLFPQVIALIICFKFIEPKVFTRGESNVFSHMRKAIEGFRKNRRLRYLALADIFRFALGESAFLFRPAFYASLWPVWAIGLAGAGSFFGSSIGFYFASRIIKKYKEFKVLIGEVLINRVIMYAGLLFPTVLSPAFMTLTSVNFGVAWIALKSLMQKEFTDEQRATMGSLSSFLGNITFAVFACLLGLAGDFLGPVNGLLLINTAMLVVIVFYWKIFKHPVS
jgi:MFS family permease